MQWVKKLRRCCAPLLCAAMLLALLSGCGGSGGALSSDAPASADAVLTQPEEEPGQSSAAEENSGEEGPEETGDQTGAPTDDKQIENKAEIPAKSDTAGESKGDAAKPAQKDNKDSDAAFTCTISISCATILDHMDECDSAKVSLVPEDGWILQPTEVSASEGDSVFDVLQRTCKQYKIHMEYSNTPLYNSAYIEGIHNLYEFDVGSLSGWMYSVNGQFPNYGCSRYFVQSGDVIRWEYTCDLGVDVGGGSASQQAE